MPKKVLVRGKKLIVRAWGIEFRPRLRLVGDGEAVQTFSWVRAVPQFPSEEVRFEWQISLNGKLDSVEEAIAQYFAFLQDFGARPVPHLTPARAVWIEDK